MKIKKYNNLLLVAVLVIISTVAASAQESDPHLVERVMGDMILLLGIVGILAGFWGILRMNSMIMDAQKIQLIQEHGEAGLEKAGMLQKETFWQRQMKRWTKAVPVEREHDVMLDHNYDGIRELDNSLPPWWVAMFYVTILFAGVYMTYYHFTDYGASSTEQYEMEMEQAEEAKKAYLASQANLVDESNAEMITAEDQLAIGEASFIAKCAACHGQLGEGGVGPNLTDQYWLHGGDIKDVFKTIKYGVPEKGMIAWQAQMGPAEMLQVASFIKTLEDTNPPNAKEPQGEIYQQAANMESDSTATDENKMIGMAN